MVVTSSEPFGTAGKDAICCGTVNLRAAGSPDERDDVGGVSQRAVSLENVVFRAGGAAGGAAEEKEGSDSWKGNKRPLLALVTRKEMSSPGRAAQS
jgi:hypothetical protein